MHRFQQFKKGIIAQQIETERAALVIVIAY
jgi:hypothetical protein